MNNCLVSLHSLTGKGLIWSGGRDGCPSRPLTATMWRHRTSPSVLTPILWFSLIILSVLVTVEANGSDLRAKRVVESESMAPQSNFAQSLTRDFLFFISFVSQVVLFLIFFWEKPTTTKRWNVGEEAAEDERVPNSEENTPSETVSAPVEPVIEELKSSAPVGMIAPPEGSRATNDDGRASTQLDDDFEPLEESIRDLQHRISGLERTLHRRKGHYPTESLKSRLRECISTITGTLSTLEAQTPSEPSTHADIERSPSPNRLDITKWPLESIQSSKRQLEQQLAQLEAAHVTRADSPSLNPVPHHQLEKLDKALIADSKSLDLSDKDLKSPSATHTATEHKSEPASKPAAVEASPADDINEEDLEALAQHVIGNKKGKKGRGKVKISAKDASALSFFATGATEENDPQPQSIEPTIDVSNIDVSMPLKPESDDSEEATKTVPAKADTPPASPPASPRPKKETSAEAQRLTSLYTTPDPEPSEKTEEDEMAELANLVHGGGGKKKSKLSKMMSPLPAKTPSVPANIFNMFDAPAPEKTPKKGKKIASPVESPTSTPRSAADNEQDDLTKDLLAQLGGVPGLDDLSLPASFDLPKTSADSDSDSDDNNNEVDPSTADLLAALTAVSDAQKKHKSHSSDSDESDDSDSDSDSDEATSDVETTEDEEDEELDEIARERPTVSAFSASEALNKSGLARAKKSVPLNKGGKKGSYQMEDYNFCAFPWEKPTWGLFCVFDGHSGKDCAEKASKTLPGKLKQRIEESGLDLEAGGVDMTEVFEKAFADTDKELEEFEYEGCTTTVVFVYKASSGHRYLQAANVGDSSATLVRKNKAVELTEDHHPNYPKEIARLAKLGIEINPGQTRLNGLAVSRALGDHFPKSTDCGIVGVPSVSAPCKLKDSDSHLILASDGLWDVISFQTASDIIKDMDSVEEMSEALLKTATRSSKCTDNVTTIVVQL